MLEGGDVKRVQEKNPARVSHRLPVERFPGNRLPDPGDGEMEVRGCAGLPAAVPGECPQDISFLQGPARANTVDRSRVAIDRVQPPSFAVMNPVTHEDGQPQEILQDRSDLALIHWGDSNRCVERVHPATGVPVAAHVQPLMRPVAVSALAPPYLHSTEEHPRTEDPLMKPGFVEAVALHKTISEP